MTKSVKDLLWLIFILIVVGVIWSMQKSGDVDSLLSGGGPRLSPKSQLNIQEILK